MDEQTNSRCTNAELTFTGERFLPDLIEKSIVAEHFQRYNAVLDIVKGKKVLDAACGSGYGTALMASTAENVTGIDISAEAIGYAKSRYAELGNVQYIEASIAELPFDAHSFDVIVSFETIEHVNEELQNSFLREIRRCLKEDGILIMSSPDKRTYSDLPGFNNEFHVKEFYFEEFEAFLKKEFRYCKHYLQGAQNISGEVIHAADGKSSGLKILNKADYQRDNDLYVISICSNHQAGCNSYDLSSLFCYEYVPTAYTYAGKTYLPENIIYPASFENNEICTVKFNLEGRKTDGRIRFDPLENACCTIELLSIRTDAMNTRAASLNHMKQEGSKYTFITIDPIIEIFGDFSQATYLEIIYRLSILDTRTVSLLANRIFTAELNARQQEIADKQQELFACRQELESMRNQKEALQQELKLITSTRGYRALEKLRAIRRKIFGETR